jgi:hypothetical protein
LYRSLYFGGEFGRNRHTCSLVNPLAAHQKMQNGILTVLLHGSLLSQGKCLIKIVWVLTIKGPLICMSHGLLLGYE